MANMQTNPMQSKTDKYACIGYWHENQYWSIQFQLLIALNFDNLMLSKRPKKLLGVQSELMTFPLIPIHKMESSCVEFHKSLKSYGIMVL